MSQKRLRLENARLRQLLVDTVAEVGPSLDNGSKMADRYRIEFAGLEVEHFKVAFVDNSLRHIKVETISIGTVDRTVVHPREVFCTAVRERATAIVLLHNHPSGDTEPSNDDIKITARLKSAGEILGIEVVDHLIFGKGLDFYAFRNSGLM